MRRLGSLTGLSLGQVSKSVRTLVEARLLRVLEEGKGKRGNRYIARERLDVRLGERVLCTIVVDYVPATLRSTVVGIDRALVSGESAAEVFAACEIVPGEGFSWDVKGGLLRSSISSRDLPPLDLTEEELKRPLVQRVLAIQRKVVHG